MIGRKIVFSFLALIFLPLVLMAVFSGTIINQEVEKYATNNLETNLKIIKLIYNHSADELEKRIINKASQINIEHQINSVKELKIVKKELLHFDRVNSIDISIILGAKELNNYAGIKDLLNAGLKGPVSSTEIIPSTFINKYTPELKKRLIAKSADNKPIIASLAQISVCPVGSTGYELVGIRFINQNHKIWNEISETVRGRVLFIQKNYIVSEIIKDKVNEHTLIGSKISSSIYDQIKHLAIFTSSVNLSDNNYVSAIEPISNYNNSPIGAMFLAASQNEFSEFKKRNATLIVLTIMAVGIITSTAAYLISQSMIKSLGKMASVASAVKNGDLSRRTNLTAKDKIGDLGYNIDSMIDALQDREVKIREYQREIQEQKENLEAIFNSLADGVVTITNDCKIIKVNPTVCMWIGLNEEDIIGKKLTYFIECDCELNCNITDSEIQDICPIITLNERLSPSEARIVNHTTKTEKALGLTSAPIAGIEGEPTFVIVLRDITELKAINHMRDDFMATLTHDLRVPILAESNTIKYFLKGIFGSYTEKQKEAFENMLESNNDLLGLVNSLLDTYKYESGRSELYKEPIHIKKLTQDLIAELTPLAKRNEQALNNLISKELPVISVDKNEIKRVIRNLINNAITYSHKGGTIAIDAEKIEENIVIKVSDTGKGIPENEIEHIFDRFFSKAKKFRKIGTGLGLYLSKQIIERHKGKIWVESAVGVGSTFYISLPLEES